MLLCGVSCCGAGMIMIAIWYFFAWPPFPRQGEQVMRDDRREHVLSIRLFGVLVGGVFVIQFWTIINTAAAFVVVVCWLFVFGWVWAFHA